MTSPKPLTVTVNVDTPAIQEYIIQSMAAAWDRCLCLLLDEGCLSESERAYYLDSNPYRKNEET